MAHTPQYDFKVNLDDLAFILAQIKIAENTTNPTTGAVEGTALRDAVGSPLRLSASCNTPMMPVGPS